MQTIQPLTIDSAPEASRAPMEELRGQVGFLPNLAAAMANSPALLRGFLAVRSLYEKGSFTPAEIQVLSLTAAFENDCAWCMAFHTFVALKAGVSEGDVALLRAGRSPADGKLAALSDYARAMVRGRGAVAPEATERLLAAGYTREQSLEVVLGMAFSLLANYAGHLADAPLDPPFQPHAWRKPA